MISIDGMTKVGEFAAANFPRPEDHEAAAELVRKFLFSMDWVKDVRTIYFDRGFLQFAVFYCKFEPVGDWVPEDVWVISGDVPPMIMPTSECKNGAEAMAGYVWQLIELVQTYKRGKALDSFPALLSSESLDPLDVNEELISLLIQRVTFIVENVFPDYQSEIESFSFPLTRWKNEIRKL